MHYLIKAGIAGGIAGGIAVIIYGLSKKPVFCPKCKTKLPRIRIPKNKRQAAWGGWSCPKCGTEVDRNGKEVKKR